MLFGLFTSPMWQLIEQSDWVSKYIILLGLFMLSVYCVAIIINRLYALEDAKKASGKLKKSIFATTALSECQALSKEFELSIGASLITTAIQEIHFLKDTEKKILTSNDYDLIANILAHKTEIIMQDLQLYMPVLNTAAAASPLIGLFGTIWGLIHSFVRISQEKSADIATVAPGIAEALLTTLAGLIVAIPALVAFNYFANQLQTIENNLTAINEHLLIVIQKSQRS